MRGKLKVECFSENLSKKVGTHTFTKAKPLSTGTIGNTKSSESPIFFREIGFRILEKVGTHKFCPNVHLLFENDIERKIDGSRIILEEVKSRNSHVYKIV
ncbi:hypothetical protein DLM78_07180 [Leptospira stimsonii]|uniref:Uncharacterized protein n=1 Tax=Leptospira stimsonii TaxID=2202203 RepID=A0A8B3CVI5_9LEPT|nr:hypothetical protein DLM78_07180 [Leptospira stimsonii]